MKFVLFICFGALMFMPAAPAADTVMRASWYAGPNRHTADGTPFHPENPHIAASPTLPFGTVLRVTNRATDRTLLVTVHDRGPFVRGRKLDLTRAGARTLGYLHSGTAVLHIEVVYRPD